MITPEFINKTIDNAPSLGISLFALWVVSKRLWVSQEQHLESYKDRLKGLEKHATDCNEDREELHRKQSDLQTHVIDQLTKMAESR